MAYQIGDFSKISQLSIKTLRFYHEKGILEPAFTDSESGYRYYDEDALTKARAIKVLRDFEFSIKEIKKVIHSCQDDSDLVDALQSKAEEINKTIKRYQTMRSSINEIIKQEEEVTRMKTNNSIQEKTIEDTLIASMRFKAKYDAIGPYIGKLYKTCGRFKAGTLFCMYWDEGYVEGDADIEICLPVNKVITKGDIQSRILKGGLSVSIIHKGAYGTQGSSYQAIFDYMKSSNLESEQPPREVLIKGPGMVFKGNPKNYITEIIMPVQKREEP